MTQTDDTGYPEPDEKQIKAHKTGKHLEILRDKLWKARDEISHFTILTDAMGALDERVGQADQKAQLARSQIDDAIHDLNSEIKRLKGGDEIREKIHSEDALDRAYQTGWEHGAADATNHKEYKLPISEPMHDEWDKRYATGYDAGFEKVATSDEPPETPSRPEYIRESRFA